MFARAVEDARKRVNEPCQLAVVGLGRGSSFLRSASNGQR